MSATIRATRIERELAMLRDVGVPLEVDDAGDSVALDLRFGERELRVRFSFPPNFPFGPPTCDVLRGFELVKVAHRGAGSRIRVPSLEDQWSPSHKLAEIVNEVLLVCQTEPEAEAAGGGTDAAIESPPDGTGVIRERFFGSGETVDHAELARYVIFFPGLRRVSSSAVNELRYVGISPESLFETKPHATRINHLVVLWQRPLRSLQRIVLRDKAHVLEFQFGRTGASCGV